jgi:hypothetical protein
MRKFLSISLLLILLLNLFGFYVAFKLQQDKISEEMSGLIKDNKGHQKVLSLTLKDYAELNWTQRGREFRMNDRLYDVAKIETSGKYVRVYVEDDEQETQLVSNFISTVQQQSEKNTSSPLKTLLEHFLKDFTASDTNVIVHPARKTAIVTGLEECKLPVYTSDLLSPPPQLG